MALISCPECGRQVSEKATACPQCAHPMSVAAPTTKESKSPEPAAATKASPSAVTGPGEASNSQQPTVPAKQGGFLDPGANVRALVRVGLLLAVLAVLIGVVYQRMGRSGQQIVDGTIGRTALGRVAIPWHQRAESVLRTMLDGASGPPVARTVQSVLHPSGSGGQLSSYTIRSDGDGLGLAVGTRPQ